MATQDAVTTVDMTEVTGPGTTIASRRRSRTRLMACTAPLRAAASTTTVPQAVATRRLRMLKRCRSGSAPGGYSLTSKPFAMIWSNSAELPVG